VLTAIVLLLARVGAAAPTVRIAGTADGAQVAEIVRIAQRAQVIGIGESHDHPAHHAAQARIVEALAAGGMPLALAFEMLTQDQQALVDAAMEEDLSQEQLGARLRWTARGWPDFAMYFPLFETARRHRLPVIAADLDVASVRAISRRGLGTLSDPERERFGSRLPADPQRAEALRRELNDAHCGLLPAPAQTTMSEAWHARNVTMARRVLEAVDRGRVVVLITGRGHLAADTVPGQLAALRPGIRVVTVDLVEDGLSAIPEADVVWGTTRLARSDKCEELKKRAPKWNDGTSSGQGRSL
jgi:uncharacterized iron-regulated protein